MAVVLGRRAALVGKSEPCIELDLFLYSSRAMHSQTVELSDPYTPLAGPPFVFSPEPARKQSVDIYKKR